MNDDGGRIGLVDGSVESDSRTFRSCSIRRC